MAAALVGTITSTDTRIYGRLKNRAQQGGWVLAFYSNSFFGHVETNRLQLVREVTYDGTNDSEVDCQLWARIQQDRLVGSDKVYIYVNKGTQEEHVFYVKQFGRGGEIGCAPLANLSSTRDSANFFERLHDDIGWSRIVSCLSDHGNWLSFIQGNNTVLLWDDFAENNFWNFEPDNTKYRLYVDKIDHSGSTQMASAPESTTNYPITNTSDYEATQTSKFDVTKTVSSSMSVSDGWSKTNTHGMKISVEYGATDLFKVGSEYTFSHSDTTNHNDTINNTRTTVTTDGLSVQVKLPPKSSAQLSITYFKTHQDLKWNGHIDISDKTGKVINTAKCSGVWTNVETSTFSADLINLEAAENASKPSVKTTLAEAVTLKQHA